MDALRFEPQVEVERSSIVTSNTITVAGLSGPTAVSALDLTAVTSIDGADNDSVTPIANATSNTNPYILSGDEFNASNALWEALDSVDNGGGWFSSVVGASAPANFIIDLTAPRLINKFRFKASSSSDWDVKGFTLHGSVDGVSWVPLFSHSNATYYNGVWTPYFTFEVPAEGYQHLRLEFTEHGTNGASLIQIEFIEHLNPELGITGPNGIHNDSVTPIAPATSDTTPYNITGISADNTAVALWKLFDGVSGTGSSMGVIGKEDSDPTPRSVYIDLGEKKVINKYRVYGYELINANYATYAWTLYGSNDGSTWTELHRHRRDDFYYDTWSPYFTFVAPSDGFRHLRIEATEFGSVAPSFSEIEFIEHTAFTQSDYEPHILIINGVESGTSGIVNNGDTLAVKIAAPTTEHTPKFLNVDFDSYKQSVFAIQTDGEDYEALDPAYIGKIPFEFVETYANTQPENQLFTISDSNSASPGSGVSSALVDVGVPDGGTLNNSKPYIFAADYYGDKLQRIDTDTGDVVHTISVTKPYAVAYTPVSAPSTTEPTHTIVACPDTNKVNIYSGSTHSLLHSVDVGNKPVAVAGTTTEVLGDFGFYVACHDDDTVEYWTSTQGAAPVLDTTYTFPADSGPAFILINDNTLWVSMIKSRQLAHASIDTTVVGTPVNLSSDPWSLTSFDGSTHVYVALPVENKILAVRKTDRVTTDIPTVDEPSFISIIDSYLWVVAYSSGSVTRYLLTGTDSISDQTDWNSQRLGAGITWDASSSDLYVLNMFKDAPSKVVTFDKDPSNFDLSDLSGQTVDTEVPSNEVTISGVTDTAPMSIPTVFGLKIIKNDVDVGTDTTVTNGDRVTIKLTTSSSDDITFSAPVLFDSTFEVWEVTTGSITRTRVSGWLGGG